jgi:hypothetical protein
MTAVLVDSNVLLDLMTEDRDGSHGPLLPSPARLKTSAW